VCATRDEEATVAIESLLLQGFEFGEESGDVNDYPGSDQVDSFGVYQS
jgi:hypothetical protein